MEGVGEGGRWEGRRRWGRVGRKQRRKVEGEESGDGKAEGEKVSKR